MKKLLLLILLTSASLPAEEARKGVRPTGRGFVTLGWMFAKTKEDLYDIWAKHDDNVKLKGSVNKFLDWPNVSKTTVIHNAWHLPLAEKDIRIQHIEDNLKNAEFGDRIKGSNPGGAYVFLLQYRNSDKQVLLCFSEGIFIIESNEGIGVIDIRKTH